jgi:hypothetical protein
MLGQTQIQIRRLKILLIDSQRQCCGPGMFIPDPYFTHPGSRIPDPKTATKERGEKKLFFVATNFTKLQIISFF